MRRLHTITKDAIIQSRYRISSSRETCEAQIEAYGESAMEDMLGLYGEMEDNIRDYLLKVIGIEVGLVVNEFEIGDEVAVAGSAFPGLKQIEESIAEYILQLVEDVIDCHTLPAIALCDEIEEWLNDLYDHHNAIREGKDDTV